MGRSEVRLPIPPTGSPLRAVVPGRPHSVGRMTTDNAAGHTLPPLSRDFIEQQLELMLKHLGKTLTIDPSSLGEMMDAYEAAYTRGPIKMHWFGQAATLFGYLVGLRDRPAA